MLGHELNNLHGISCRACQTVLLADKVGEVVEETVLFSDTALPSASLGDVASRTRRRNVGEAKPPVGIPK